MKKFLILFSVIIFVWGCDIVNKPVDKEELDPTALNPIYNDTTFNDTTSSLRNILLEDYTGSACGNCPAAAVVAKDMVTKYGIQIIPIGVHANFFADISIHTDFHTDYRTEAGETYFDFFKVLTNPKGMVNRVPYLGNRVLGFDQWDLAIQAIKDTAKIVDLKIKNIYNTEKRVSMLQVKVEFLINSTSKYKLVAHLVEDGIIDKQANYEVGGDPNYASPKELNYPHSHVLRDTYGDLTWGKEVNSGDVISNEVFEINFDNFNIKTDFVDSNCEIVVYIYDDTTKEVIQVEKLHLRK